MIHVKAYCHECRGTGLYVGLAERDGAAVVCSRCHGTGCVTVSYDPFVKRLTRREVTRVYERPGAVVVTGSGEFGGGGISREAWERGESFVGHEDRENMCPRWWTGQRFEIAACQELLGGQMFSSCPSFPGKAQCWAEYDASLKK